MTNKANNRKGQYALYYYDLLYCEDSEYPFSASTQDNPKFFNSEEDAYERLKQLRAKGYLVGSVTIIKWTGDGKYDFDFVCTGLRGEN